jgi:ankyrin repeat protein
MHTYKRGGHMDRINFLVGICFVSTLLAMDDPHPEDNNKKKQASSQSLYFDILKENSSDILTNVLPTYMAGYRAQVRDNRGDTLGEQLSSTKTYKQLLVTHYKTDTVPHDAAFIETILKQISSDMKRPKLSVIPNRVCLTAHFNPQLLREEFRDIKIRAERVAEFSKLPQEQKNKSALQVMRFCPSAKVIEELLQAGAHHNARDESSGYCLVRLAIEAQISVRRKKRLLDVFKKRGTFDPDCADRRGITPLMRAVSLQDAYTVDMLINASASVNATDHAYNTALGIAARVGDASSITKILAKHANLFLCHPYHQCNNVFSMAVQCPDASQAIPILNQLILARNTQGDITKIQEFEHFIDLALIEAARLGRADCVNFLMYLPNIPFEKLEKKPPFFNPDIPAADHDDSALTASLHHGFYDITLSLLANAPDIPKHSMSLSCQMREQALSLAVQLRCQSNEETDVEKCTKLDTIIKNILKTKVVPKADSLCLPACYQAACANHAGWLKKLLAHGKKKDPEIADKVLLHAATNAHAQAMSAILEHTSPDVVDMNGETALHKATIVVNQDTLNCVAVLLNHDANLFKGNKWNQTVFHKIPANNDGPTRKALLQMFAEQVCSKELLKDMVNKASSDTGDTPLLVACALPDRTETVQQLIAMGADVNKANNNGETPLFIAVAHFNVEIVKALLDAGADPNAKNLSGCGPLTKVAGARFHKEEENLRAKEIVKLLCAKGARVQDFIHSMLRNAARNGNTQLVIDLLKLGADPTKGSSSFNNSALHQAAKKGHEDTVALLLQCSNEHAQNAYGFTALELACVNDVPYDVTERFLFNKKS